MQTSCCFHNIHTLDSRLLVFLLKTSPGLTVTSLIHGYFRGCPCLRLRYANDVSPNRTRLCCLRFLCSPRFVADPLSPISSWDAGRDLSVPGSGSLSKSFPAMVFSLKTKKGHSGSQFKSQWKSHLGRKIKCWWIGQAFLEGMHITAFHIKSFRPRSSIHTCKLKRDEKGDEPGGEKGGGGVPGKQSLTSSSLHVLIQWRN